jgi:hypothetical protein
MSKASAYGDEIWQVDSLPQNADRMFISLKSLKGFASGRGQRPQNSMKRFCVDYRRINIPVNNKIPSCQTACNIHAVDLSAVSVRATITDCPAV